MNPAVKANTAFSPTMVDKNLITLDENSGVPIWMQLRNRLVYLVVSGTVAPGSKLPTVRDLSSFLSVNYNTVSKVYRDIEKDGYVITRRGKGTFVAEVNSEGFQAADAKAAIFYKNNHFFRFGGPAAVRNPEENHTRSPSTPRSRSSWR